MMTRDLLSILWCPTCQGGPLHADPAPAAEAEVVHGELACAACGSRYPVAGGVPGLIPHDATNGGAWALWRRHLDKLQARREDRIARPARAAARVAKTSRAQAPFARFTGVVSGRVLDVGCGPGGFRANFDAQRVWYVGLDPIALPRAREFPFVRGVAEYLPFREGAFTDVVVLAALDHFRDPALFFREAARVLAPNGRLHVLQSVHELRGMASVVKVLGHKVKDAIEAWDTRAVGRAVPKHLREFTARSLVEGAAPCFDVSACGSYDPAWYAPTKVFVSFRPNGGARGRGGLVT